MKKIYISKNSHSSLLQYLHKYNCDIQSVNFIGITYEPVFSHPDIFFCRMGAGEHSDVFAGNISEIGFNYPENIRFNAVCLDKYFIHSLKYTSPTLLKSAEKRGLKLINVNQGYTKCNTVVVDGHSVITSDEGISRTLSNYSDIDVLKVRQGFVKLTGFKYGFIGGASGRVGNEILFNGNLSAHPDSNSICKFIQKRGLDVKYFPEYELEDIGSIISE